MSTGFSNIDFGFRYGNSRAVSHSDLLDGTFVIATDTGELYIDIGGIRVPMNKDIFKWNFFFASTTSNSLFIIF